MIRSFAVLFFAVFMPGAAIAQWCDPPIAPPPTAADVAMEFREEFKAEFDQYFQDASRYTTCLEDERSRIIEEMRVTAERYERFLQDSQNWPAQ